MSLSISSIYQGDVDRNTLKMEHSHKTESGRKINKQRKHLNDIINKGSFYGYISTSTLIVEDKPSQASTKDRQKLIIN